MPHLDRKSLPKVALATVLVAAAALSPIARADSSSIAFLQQVRTGYAVQTGDVLMGQGYDLQMNVALIPGHGFDALAWHTPAGERIDLSIDGVGLGFYFKSPRYSTVGEMDERFGAGEYSHDLTGPGVSGQATLTATLGAYPDTLPFLTGTTYADLQGMDPTLPFDFHLSPVGAGQTITFFVDDVLTGTTVFASGASVPPVPDTLTMPAHLLQGGRTYEFQFYVGQRIDPPISGAGGGSQGFTYLTTGTFTTAVPEPASVLLMLGGLTALVGTVRRRRPHS